MQLDSVELDAGPDLVVMLMSPAAGAAGALSLDLTQRVVNVKWGEPLAVEFAKGDG